MTHFKRHFINIESFQTTTNKLRKICDDKEILSCFENLSNELYYEIFDYLEGCQLYKAFSNLNIRFENLLNSSFLRLTIDLNSYSETILKYQSNHIFIPNKHKIISLKLINNFYHHNSNFSPFIIDSSFNHLQSLELNFINSTEILPLLVNLISLPCLFSLTISTDDKFEINNIYQTIFNLPKLKYTKLSICLFEKLIPLSIETNQQYTNIEYLNINHSCALNQLIVILSHTPRLCHLKCKRIYDSNKNITRESSVKISTLIKISIDNCYAKFNELEIFITKISCELQVLHIKCFNDVAYLDADRWERIISQYLFHLHIFQFKYEEIVNNNLQNTQNHKLIKQFNSSFWIKRNWIFRIYINQDFWMNNILMYAILPYKNSRVNFVENKKEVKTFLNDLGQNAKQQIVNFHKRQTVDYPMILSEIHQLNIIDYLDNNNNEFLIDYIGPIISRQQITCLHITRRNIFIGILINLIKYLPNLDSLVVSSLSMFSPQYLSFEKDKSLPLVSNNNQITKVKLYQMNNVTDVQFLFELCLHMQYLQVDDMNDITPERFVRFILTKNINYVNDQFSLCFNISETKEDIVDNLKKMIDLEQFHYNYRIQQIDNRIYLQWNL